MISLIFALLLALVVAVFATFNQAAVDLYFFEWVLYQVPISIVIIVSALVGAVAGFLVTGIRRISESSAANKEIRRTKEDLQDATTREARLAEENKELRIARETALSDYERSVSEISQLRAELSDRDKTIHELRTAETNRIQQEPRATTIETRDTEVIERTSQDYERSDRDGDAMDKTRREQQSNQDTRPNYNRSDQLLNGEDDELKYRASGETHEETSTESDQQRDETEEITRQTTVTRKGSPPVDDRT